MTAPSTSPATTEPATTAPLTPAAPLSVDPIALTDLRPGQWLAMHIFYTSNPIPLLTECVAPLVRELRERGLIAGFFYIRYWLEGPHTRVRLKPARVADVPEIRRLAEAAVDAYLRRRPAVYEVDMNLSKDMYKQMFLTEYSEEQWEAQYGDSEEMPVRPNNSHAYIEYVPEYDRYGGEAGIELSEWHFEKSSDLALRLIDTTNVHVRSVLFGLGVQLMAVMCFTFLRDPQRCADFMHGYSSYWESSYQTGGPSRHSLYDEAYGEMAASVQQRVAEIYAAVTAGRPEQLTGFVRDWAEHCAELRERVVDLVDRRQLIFQAWELAAERVPATDLDLVFRVLLSSYVHMTDNRLGITIHDEIYLSYVLRKAILDRLVPAAQP
jgi:thiopeptide-type bacteriocin biosynthesis protein